jgi:hypothetical protein
MKQKFLSIQLISWFMLSFICSSYNPIIAQTENGGKQKKGQGQNAKGGGKGKANRTIVIENGNLVMGAPTHQSITANLLFNQQAEAYIAYGTKSGTYQQSTSHFRAEANNPLVITISGLKPNQNYYYQLHFKLAGDQDFQTTKESWFATQKTKDAEFSFGVQGDSHPEREGKMFSPLLYHQTIDSVAANRPDFYFMLGDDFSIDHLIERNQVAQDQVENVYKTQRQYLGIASKNTPLFLVNGNHEQAAKYLLDGTANNAAVLAGNARKKYFPLPSPDAFYSGDTDTVNHVGLLKDYYAFEWGNALFVVIDPYWHSNTVVDNQPGAREQKPKRNLWDITLGEAQYQWFKQTLENSKAKYKFVFAHHVSGTGRGGVERAKLFEWGGYGQNGVWQFDQQRPGWGMPIHQLMVKNKVSIFFQGHDHIYAKQALDGVIYQSVPNPADDTHTAFNEEAYQSGVKLPNSGFLKVSVSKKGLQVDYIRSYLKDNPSLKPEATTPYSYQIK